MVVDYSTKTLHIAYMAYFCTLYIAYRPHYI